MKLIHVLGAALALLGTAALADAPSTATPTAPSTANAVFVGGTPIMRVRVAAGGYTPEERATHIQNRLNLILGHGPITPSDITVEPTNSGEYTVDVKGRLLFTADSSTARFNDATPLDLANQWADNMRQVLPSLTAPK
jgi:hypothetical protein